MKNYKEIPLEEVYKKDNNNIQEISIIGDLIFWIENLNFENNKVNAIFVKPFQKKDYISQNITGESFLIRNNFHGYGGKSYKCIPFEDKLFLIWIDIKSKSLWGQFLSLNESRVNNQEYLSELSKPIKLTKSIEGNFDSSFTIINKNLLYGLIEIDNSDYLFCLKINDQNQNIKLLKRFDYFAGSLSSQFEGNVLSWLEWGHSCMPWEKNDLFFADVNNSGEIGSIKKFEDITINQNKEVSFFQPYWLNQNTLVCSEDSTGWWNLLFLEINQIDDISIKKRINKKFYEYGVPQWQSGISLFSGKMEKFFCLFKHDNYWNLEYYQNLHCTKKIVLPFLNVKDLDADSNKIIFIASNKNNGEKLIQINLNCIEQSTYFLDSFKQKSPHYSEAKSFWFKGSNNKDTHAWLYKPNILFSEKPPLIIKAHSGPTSHFDGSFSKEIQFWTSRGWYVGEVNYGGSSGFGREYRERLNGSWGVVDSEDCNQLALNLIKNGIVDLNSVVIFGNSAGGFTAINCLKGNTIFKAAICKYPVLDLLEMHKNTHRFEKDYLKGLVGDFNENENLYFSRSPINNLGAIKRPLLLFHGKKDQVVNYKNTLIFHQKISQLNIYSELHLLEEEGHGFREIINKEKVLKTQELFLKKILNF